MRRGLGLTLLAAAMIGAGCGGDGDAKEKDPFAYDAAAPLNAEVGAPRRVEQVDVRRVVYAGADGDRVPGLFAVPVGQEAGPCLVYQGGIGSRKEDARSVWQGLAGIGTATFTIDVPDQGERADDPDAFKRDLNDPDALVAWIRRTVIDLRRGLDFLGSRPECAPDRLGFAGLSQGGLLGILLTGADTRVRAAAFLSTGGDWDRALTPDGLILPEQAADPKAREAALRKLAPLGLRKWVARIAPRPVLFVNGDSDPGVPVAGAKELQRSAGEPKQAFVYAGGHNTFENDQALGVIATFLRRQLVEGGS